MTTPNEAKTRLFTIRFIHAIHRGMTVAEIAEKFGVQKGTVRARARSYGLTIMRKRDLHDEDMPPAEESAESEES